MVLVAQKSVAFYAIYIETKELILNLKFLAHVTNGRRKFDKSTLR